MIIFTFSIENPFYDRFDIVKSTHFNVSETKVIELNLYKTNDIIEFCFRFTKYPHCHSGINFSVGLFGFQFEIMLYDTRH